MNILPCLSLGISRRIFSTQDRGSNLKGFAMGIFMFSSDVWNIFVLLKFINLLVSLILSDEIPQQMNIFCLPSENPPTISSVTKTPVSFYEGGRVTLHCSATGNTPLTYQWFATDFEGNAKDVSSGRHSQQPSTGQLVINSLNHTLDDGYYYCVARNPAGKTRSTRLKIQVSCKWLNYYNLP